MQFPFTLKKDTDFDVVGFGTNAVDFLIQVPHYPEFNSKVELNDYVQAAGGEVATSMAGLQRLGLRTSYIGRFGNDHAGEIGIESLCREGVDMRFAETIDGARTQIAFIVIDERNGERTVIWKRDEKLHYTPDEVPLEAVASTKVLHFTPHDARACLRLAEEARARGTIISIDVDNVFEDIEHLLGMMDVIIASSDFPAKLFGPIEARAALHKLQRRFGAAVVGITLGENGSLLLCDDNLIETSGFDVPGGCKDTTGAGDSFRVGLLYGMIKGESIEDSARIANAVAALKCRAIGARTALPTPDEVDDLMKKI
jgi:sugar/nucleoside kinase (ribokinase family)